MNLDEIDQLLPKWQQDIQAASANLVAFEGSVAYQMVKNNLPKLTGRTKAEITPAIEDVGSILPHFALLDEVIKQAMDLRKDMPQIFGRGDRILKIEQLLTGKSICLKTEEVPLAERGLTGASQRMEKISPQDLFTQMQKRFEAGAKAAALYEKSYLDLTEKLGKAFEELDKPTVYPNPVLRAQLDQVKDLIDTDPLTGLEKFNSATRKPKPPSEKPKLKETPKQSEAVALPPKIETTKPNPAPVVNPAPAVSRLVQDNKVGRLVAAESLSPLESMILNAPPAKEKAKQPVVSSTDAKVKEMVESKETKTSSRLESMIQDRKHNPNVSEKAPIKNPSLENLINDPRRGKKGK